jgi:hypothetical protein
LPADIFHEMKKLLFLLLVLLPLQWTAAAVASYCQHETGLAAKHTGHHDHKHESSSETGGQTPKSSGAIDDDCAICHLSCGGLTASEHSFTFGSPQGSRLVFDPLIFPSVIPARPERPNWWLLA